MTYVARPASQASKIIAYLEAHNGRGTAVDIAEAVGMEARSVHAMLRHPISVGAIRIDVTHRPSRSRFERGQVRVAQFVLCDSDVAEYSRPPVARDVWQFAAGMR